MTTETTTAKTEGQFTVYATRCWLNVHRDERGWYVTHGLRHTLRQMKREGWTCKATGQTELMADDSIRQYFTVDLSK
jgi:hypothetical protein